MFRNVIPSKKKIRICFWKNLIKFLMKYLHITCGDTLSFCFFLCGGEGEFSGQGFFLGGGQGQKGGKGSLFSDTRLVGGRCCASFASLSLSLSRSVTTTNSSFLSSVQNICSRSLIELNPRDQMK